MLDRSEEFLQFWRERHLCTLTTVRADGTPHVVAIGATLDKERGLVRVITRGGSHKARTVRAGGNAGVPAAVCQVDGRRWSTVEGRAVLRESAGEVAEAECRYAQRYRVPKPNPQRVVIEITPHRVLGLR